MRGRKGGRSERGTEGHNRKGASRTQRPARVREPPQMQTRRGPAVGPSAVHLSSQGLGFLSLLYGGSSRNNAG